MILKQVGFVIVASVLIGGFASAAALKCGTKYVRQGDTEFEVIQKCGEPFYTSRGGRNWYYEQSHGSFVREVIFNGRGRVTRVNMVNPGT